MAQMHAVYYRDCQGREPVSDFIDSLPPRVQVAVDLQLDRLSMLTDTDPPLPFPHSSQIEGELRELRCHCGRRLFRILYRRSERLVVLLHAFEKTTGAVPAADIATAHKRWKDFRQRMEESRAGRHALRATTPHDQQPPSPVRKSANLGSMSDVSPVGRSAAAGSQLRAARSREYREELERLQGFEDVARQIIRLRMAHGLPQEALAKRVGTTKSAISRLESGQHAPNIATLHKIAAVLGGHLVVTFDVPEPAAAPNEAVLARP